MNSARPSWASQVERDGRIAMIEDVLVKAAITDASRTGLLTGAKWLWGAAAAVGAAGLVFAGWVVRWRFPP